MNVIVRRVRLVVLCLLLCGIGVAAWALFFTPRGHAIMHDPAAFREDVRTWIAAHPVSAPAVYIVAYALIGILALPLWWLQMLSGYGFGLVWGVIWSQIGATIGAVATTRLCRWLAGEWFHQKVEAKMRRLRRLDHVLGHNGFLVVMANTSDALVPVTTCMYTPAARYARLE